MTPLITNCNNCYFFKQKKCRLHRTNFLKYICSFYIEPIDDLNDVKDYYSLVISRKTFQKTFSISILSILVSTISVIISFATFTIKTIPK